MDGLLLLGLALASLAGCDGPSTTPPDAASTPDAAALDAAQVVDAGTDARAAIDASPAPDAFAPSDAFMPSDAFTPRDAGHDAFVATDAGHDAASRRDAGGCGTCGTGMACAYAISDACSAAPTCVTIPAGSPCGAIVLEMGCGCDGNDVMWRGGCHPALPNGYAPAPLVHMGACP